MFGAIKKLLTMKRLTVLLLWMSLFVFIPQAQAIITDPEDHVFYYSGMIAPTRDFSIPDFMGGENWEYGSTNIVFPTHTTMRNFLNVSETDTVYALILNNINGRMDLKLPCCDSIFIEFWGTGQRGIKITNDRDTRYGWNALEGNRPVTVGARFGFSDSVTISLTPTKLDINEKPTGLVYISSIKIYAPIEQSDVPVFDGVVAGWDFKYCPKESGTVDLESLATQEDGLWEDGTYYPKYASDLGVVRGKLTCSTSTDGMVLGHDCGVQAVKLESAGSNNIDDYTDGSKHDNYWQIDLSTKGYQELSLSFDFNIRYASDSCVVVYSVDDGTTWTLVGSYMSPEEESALTSVCEALPEEVSNRDNVCIRLIQGNGTDDEYFMLANLSMDGYEYVAYKEDALNVAYINTAENRIRVGERAVNTKDSLDKVVLPALMEAYNVTIFYPEKYQTATDSVSINELFADYDVVVLSSLVSAEDPIARAAKYLVGNKPLLNLNAHTYSSTNWHWATSADGIISSDVEKEMTIMDTYRYHPVFMDLTIGEGNEISLYDTLEVYDEYYKGVQGFEKASYQGGGYLMASSANTSSLTCIHEINDHPAAKYMLLGLGSDNYQHISEDGARLIVNAVQYLGEPSVFVVPTFNMTSTGAMVENMETLKAALSYDYSSRNLEEIVIEMKSSTDASGVYELGSEGLTFSVYDDLVIKAVEGEKVIVKGAFSASNQLSVQSLTYEDFCWESVVNLDALISIHEKDRIQTSLSLRNITFSQIASSHILKTENCTGAYVGQVRMEQCVFEQCEAAEIIRLDAAADYACDNIVFSNNVVKNVSVEQLFGLAKNGSTATNGFSIDMENNLFYKMGSATAAEGNFIDFSLNPHQKMAITIHNNLFYERLNEDSYPLSKIALFDKENTQQVSLSMLNNFFYPMNVCAADSKENLYVSSGNIVADYYALTMDSLDLDKVFENDYLEISKSSALYMAGLNSTYIGPEQQYMDRVDCGTLTASTLTELKVCLSIAVPGDTIELENCQDAGGMYLTGNSGLEYPNNGGNLTIRAAKGHQPVFFGRISSSNGMNLDTLMIEGLSWNGGNTALTGYNNETFSPFYIVRADTVSGAFIIKDCSFEKFNYQPVLRTKECKGAVLHQLIFEGCYFDEMGWGCSDGKTGHHFIQFDKANTYELDYFEFRDNVVKNFHGSQFFNLGTTGSTSMDSLKVIIIEHNLFYKIGGNATSERQFLGYNEKPTGYKVDIRINNNIFCERWSYEHYPVSDLAMFEPDSLQEVSLKVLNNLFYGEDVMARLDTKENLPVTGSSLKAEYNSLFLSTLDMSEVFDDTEYLEIYGTSPLYTAGVNGTYIGAIQCYTNIPEPPVTNISEMKLSSPIYTRSGSLYVEIENDAKVEIYDLLGTKLYSKQCSQGTLVIDGLSGRNVYLVRLNDKVYKVLL